MKFLKFIIFATPLLIDVSYCHTTQRPNTNYNNQNNNNDDSNPFLDMASAFLQETLSNQDGKSGGGGGGSSGSGIAGVASIIGTLMQTGSGDSKSNSGASQILSGIGSLLLANRGDSNDAGFDPSLIGNVIEMFTSTNDDDSNERNGRNLNDKQQNTRKSNDDSGLNIGSILQIASTLMMSGAGGGEHSKQDGQSRSNNQDTNFLNMLPMIMRTINSFTGPEGQRTQESHKDHAWVLPPFLEQIHVAWDHFSNSELAEALWQKSGIHAIFKGFTDRDGKLDIDRLLESLHNQSFRRRWIKAATLYLADWANYLAEPDVYQKYLKAGVLLLNGFLRSQGYPSSTHFDVSQPTETLSNLVDHVTEKHLDVKVDSSQYVKPAVEYIRELLKLGQARGLLKKFNATELSDKLTDTLNLEVIEPVLKVHRAYHYAIDTPHCDKYVLCQLNSHDPNEKLGLAGFKPGIMKFGSMAAAWFISTHSGTPFWTLISIINDPYNCEVRFPVDCTAFHEGEAKVTTEYIHTEL